MSAKLEYCGNSIEISDFYHSLDDETARNPYNCSFNIKIVSGQFSGIADGCEYDYKEWKKYITQLEDLIYFKTKEVTMIEIGYGNKIVFVGDGMGHIKVTGEIYGHAMSHLLKFEFDTDQTVFPSFIEELKKL